MTAPSKRNRARAWQGAGLLVIVAIALAVAVGGQPPPPASGGGPPYRNFSLTQNAEASDVISFDLQILDEDDVPIAEQFEFITYLIRQTGQPFTDATEFKYNGTFNTVGDSSHVIGGTAADGTRSISVEDVVGGAVRGSGANIFLIITLNQQRPFGTAPFTPTANTIGPSVSLLVQFDAL